MITEAMSEDVQSPAPRQFTRHLTGIYGVIHAAIDATCAMVVLSCARVHGLDHDQAFWLVILYNLLAFAGQAPLGLAVDLLRAPRAALLVGIAMTGTAAALLPVEAYSAVIVVGIGNALFHLGAGAFTLHTRPGRATDPGIFVAPGALGLGFGIWLGRTHKIEQWPLVEVAVAVLLISLVVACMLRNPRMPYYLPAEPVPDDPVWSPARVTRAAGALIVCLLLGSITVRALVGMAGCHACPRAVLVAGLVRIQRGIGLPLVAFGGKFLGGIVSDRVGWIETSVGALLISAPLIAFGGGNLPVIIAGLLFFQMTMPVTLVAVVKVMPRMPATGFGLCCLALIAGSLPTFFPQVKAYYDPYAFFGLILASATVVFVGLRLMGKDITTNKLLGRLYG